MSRRCRVATGAEAGTRRRQGCGSRLAARVAPGRRSGRVGRLIRPRAQYPRRPRAPRHRGHASVSPPRPPRACRGGRHLRRRALRARHQRLRHRPPSARVRARGCVRPRPPAHLDLGSRGPSHLAHGRAPPSRARGRARLPARRSGARVPRSAATPRLSRARAAPAGERGRARGRHEGGAGPHPAALHRLSAPGLAHGGRNLGSRSALVPRVPVRDGRRDRALGGPVQSGAVPPRAAAGVHRGLRGLGRRHPAFD